MKSKFPAFVALFCIFVYVAVVLFAAYRIYTNVMEQQQKAGQELDKLQSLIAHSGESFFSEPFREEIRKTLEECSVLQGIIVAGEPGTALGFENGWGNAIRWENGPRFVTRFGYTALAPRQVNISGFRNVTIHSMSQAVNYEYLANILKQSLLVILAALILSFFTMIITALSSRGRTTPKKEAFKEAPVYRTSSAAEDREDADDFDDYSDDFSDSYSGPISGPISGSMETESPAGISGINEEPDDPFSFDLPDMDAPGTDDASPLDMPDDLPSFDLADMPDMDALGIDDVPEPMSDAGAMSNTIIDDEFDIPNFDDYGAPSGEDQTEAHTETDMDSGFHLDDFLDESDLNLPEVAAMDDLGEMDSLGDLDGLGSIDSLGEMDDLGDLDSLGSMDSPEEMDDLGDIDNLGAMDDLGDLDSLGDLGDIDSLGDMDEFGVAEEQLGNEPSAALPDTASSPTPSGSPSGLYSPRSNIGWEDYTPDRLASELHRCAASEQDLVVMLMECASGVNCDGKLYRKIADEAVDLFNLHDLTFEYGDRGITVIIPNENLEQGIIKAEEYHARIFKTCYDSFHASNDFLIGMSSRSGRLVEADKLLQEAARALEKAGEEAGSPIIAFKSDPEKYREFVRKH